MNREFKRRMRREQRAQERAQMRGRSPVPVQQQQRRERVGIRQYLRDIQTELRRVIWPTTQEVITYSIVVVVVVSVLTAVVFGLDFVFFRGVIRLFTPAR